MESSHSQMMVGAHCIGIGGIGIAMTPVRDEAVFEIPGAHAAFLDEACTPDIELLVRDEPVPAELSLETKLFEAEATWRLYRRGSGYVLALVSPAFGPKPYRVVLLDETWSRGEMYTSLPREIEGAPAPVSQSVTSPWNSPLDEILVANKIADGSGVLLHACAAKEGDAGFLFLGVSGAGKSTTARLWMDAGAEALSDERVVVRRSEEGGFRVHGTPWHSSAYAASPSSASLRGIFFLSQGANNEFRPVSRIESVTRMMQCAYPTFHNRDGMDGTVGLLSDMTRDVPCFEYAFVPDGSAVDFLLEQMQVRL